MFPNQTRSSASVLRLDELRNPFAPTDAIADAMIDLESADWPVEQDIALLRMRLARHLNIDERWIVLASGIDALYAALVRWRVEKSPTTVFPPTRLNELQRVVDLGGEVCVSRRSHDFKLNISTDRKRLPVTGTSFVMSPNDPTGTVADVRDFVRLCRQSGLVVIDERHGAYSTRPAIPLTREFDNLIVLQSMEWWAGLGEGSLAWAICPPSLGAQLTDALDGPPIDREAVFAARATLDDWLWLTATVRQIGVEKGRLFRQLRKLNMLTPPYPSWSNFLLTRFARGGVDFFVPRLRERNICVQVVDQDLLPDHIRVSAVSAEATDELKRALIEIALEL
jgi:histidinol-phosphate aminotransferase